MRQKLLPWLRAHSSVKPFLNVSVATIQSQPPAGHTSHFGAVSIPPESLPCHPPSSAAAFRLSLMPSRQHSTSSLGTVCGAESVAPETSPAGSLAGGWWWARGGKPSVLKLPGLTGGPRPCRGEYLPVSQIQATSG